MFVLKEKEAFGVKRAEVVLQLKGLYAFGNGGKMIVFDGVLGVDEEEQLLQPPVLDLLADTPQHGK